ncbi:uncharacterized protein LOC143783335 [Ranitomeya variabilis]|uniref:uncharacterized protein LOC143783335 n=1 Tax=Ranitomeya variabilis TaxID=490064 RepID=UPI004056248A
MGGPIGKYEHQISNQTAENSKSPKQHALFFSASTRAVATPSTTMPETQHLVPGYMYGECIQTLQGANVGPTMSSFPLGHGGQSLMPLIRASVTPATWQVYGSFKPTVWVVGHSFVYWAYERAKLRPGGTNVGFPKLEVSWRGIKGLRWRQIFLEMVDIAKRAKGPVVLVLHAGGNDLGKRKGAELYTVRSTDVERFVGLLPDMVVVWSEIIPRAVWHGAKDVKAIENSRKRINTKTSKLVRENYGIVVRHQELEGNNVASLRPDGIHLTDVGLDIFLEGLRDGVEQALTSPLVPLPTIEVPFDQIAMDLVGTLVNPTRGHQYILVVMDYATQYTEAVPLRNTSARTIARELVHIFSRTGLRKEILTDQGTPFIFRVIKELCNTLQIIQFRTSVYHPQTGGLVEGFNKTLKAMLKKVVEKDG